MSALSEDGLTEVPAGHVAAVATFLDMRTPAAPRPVPTIADVVLRHVAIPDPDAYRDLFRRVGSECLWWSRLRISNAALMTILGDPAVELYQPERGGEPVGLLELDFRRPGACNISFFGLVPELVGQGFGRWMMTRALNAAWRDGVSRVTINTCTLDHPGALAFYLRSGFRPYARMVEVFPDPRLQGLLSRKAAPHHPIITDEATPA
jgi:GNAT superfamily N-acetyltransferase